MPDSEGVCTGFSTHRGVEREMVRLTLDEERNVDRPYTERNSHDDPVFVPNGDARGLNELLQAAAAFWKGERGRRGHTHAARLTAKRRRKPGRRRSIRNVGGEKIVGSLSLD